MGLCGCVKILHRLPIIHSSAGSPYPPLLGEYRSQGTETRTTMRDIRICAKTLHTRLCYIELTDYIVTCYHVSNLEMIGLTANSFI